MQKKLDDLKSHDWTRSIVSFYVSNRKKDMVMVVNIEEKIKKKLRKFANDNISSVNEIKEYEYITSNVDTGIYGISDDIPEFQKAKNFITGQQRPEPTQNMEDLIGSAFYIVRLDLDNIPPLYACRRISDKWTINKIKKEGSLVWKGNTLIDIGEEAIFTIDSMIDFYSFKDFMFILRKTDFEIALSFHDGMRAVSGELIRELQTINLIENLEEIPEIIGDNTRLLRRMCQIKKNGYYKDNAFISKLREINNIEGWGLVFSDKGSCIVTKDNIAILLRVLNDDRLTSKISENTFDVEVKHKITG